MIRFVLCCALAAAFSACQSIEGDMRMLFEKPPKALDAPPEKSGLVVIEASLELPRGAKLPMSGAALRREGTERIRFTGAKKDVVVFQGLPPDAYEIVWLAAPWMRYETPSKFPVPASEGGRVQVEAGVPTYLGFLRIVRHGWTDFEYLWDRSPEREAAAWRSLLERYPSTSWRAPIEARLAELAR